jgi:hypothetical protein
MKNNNKGLQKFTDFEELKTKEQFLELKNTDNVKFDELFSWLLRKINEAKSRDKPVAGEFDKYFNRLEKAIEMYGVAETPEENERIIATYKRDRWYVNEGKIKHCIHKELANNCYLPTNTQIANETGLSRVTIDKHLKAYGLNKFKTEELDKYEVLNSMALNRLYQLGMNQNNIKALTSFINYTNPSKGTINNNYIQINNTKIDNVIIENLPDDIRREIEDLIIKSLPDKYIS